MRTLRPLASILVPLALSACATTPAQLSTASASNSAAPAGKKICRDAMATGSMGFRYVCHTAAEWAQIDGLDDGSVKRGALPSTYMPHNTANH